MWYDQMKRKDGDLNLDITRIIAFFCVPGIHFFQNSGFYDEPIKGVSMYSMVYLRTLCAICVPLFILITGYLMSMKIVELKPNALLGFYKRLIPILAGYYLSTCIIFVARKVILSESIGISTLFFRFIRISSVFLVYVYVLGVSHADALFECTMASN